MRDRARLVDIALRAAWVRHTGKFAADLALVAVGGYGRGELHPSSDIDIMVLLPKSDSADWQSDIERFLTFLWDIGLEVGHSVRSIDDCQRESLADISVATTLFEARLLAGPESLFAGMRRALASDRLWSSQDFFEAKVKEQTERHHRYFDTAYNLEPNVKSSPGGLRDIQTIGWVAKRHFGTDTLDELVAHGFLTREELRKLKAGQSFLWKVRFGLHVLTGRREDRLLFDYQIKLAKLFGYEDASFTLAVEQLMQKYYRTVMDISLLNEMLLQLFREAILTQSGPPVPINARFQIRNDYLEVTHPEVFARYPSALLELFVLLQQHPELRGVRAETIRLIGAHVALIDEEFRQNPRHHRLFMEILCAPVGVTHELRRMNLYGVLGPLHPLLRPGGRPHAVRPVPRLHGGRAHAVRGEQSAAPGDSEIQRRVPRFEPDHAVAAAPGARLSGGAVSRYRERPRRRPLRARRGRCGGVLPGARPRPVRGAPGGLAGAQPFDSVHHLAEEGHQRSGHHPRFRAPRGRPGAFGLLVRAHRRGCARHQPQTVEYVEGAPVRGVLRAHQAGAAPRIGNSGRSRRIDPRDSGPGARKNAPPGRPDDRAGLVAVDRGVLPALHAGGDRVADRGASRRTPSVR